MSVNTRSQQVANYNKHVGCYHHNLLQLDVWAGGGTRLVFWGESLLEEQLECAGWGAGAHLRHRHPGFDGVRQRHENPGDAAGAEAAEDAAALEVSGCRAGSRGCVCPEEGADETSTQRVSAGSPHTVTVPSSCRSSAPLPCFRTSPKCQRKLINASFAH